jgi:methyl-accepting chemotaxis protein
MKGETRMRTNKPNFRAKLLIAGTLVTGVPLLTFGAAVWWQNSHFVEIAAAGSARLADSDLDHTVHGVYALCETARAGLERMVVENLRTATGLLDEAGGFHVYREAMVSWTARNQFTKASSTVSLPQALIGKAWLGQVKDLQTTVPVVDGVRKLTGATATVFQRMNAAGDMLRVATNVVGDDGQRAIGTYIPEAGVDGRPNPVLEKVLRGETFVGRAFVVNAWYMSAYQPIRDAEKNIVGMLYVGVPEGLATEPLRRAILDVHTGRTGRILF